MCGRKALIKNEKAIIEELMVDEWQIEDHRPNYNIAPTQYSPILIQDKGNRIVKRMRWGLIPEWSKNDSFASKMINARIETITTKPSYRNLIYKNRCMIISDGYYEWKQNSDHKTPYFIRHDDGNLLLLAGLWTIWQSPSKPMLTYTIVTTEAQKDIAHIHRRMPLILDHSNMDEWINVENDDFNIKDHAIPSKLNLDHYPVSSLVNSSSNNSKRCITPLKVSDDLNLFGDE